MPGITVMADPTITARSAAMTGAATDRARYERVRSATT